MRTFRRQYSSNYSSVSKARHDVATFARGCGLLPFDVGDITLAVGEACNNAAEHGHVSAGSFSVFCAYKKGELNIEVTDQGTGFDPRGKGERCEPEALATRGLGIFIMRSLMDDVSFTTKRSGTSVRLTKYTLRGVPADGESASTNGLAPKTGLGAVHDRLKALLKLGRGQSGHRREEG